MANPLLGLGLGTLARQGALKYLPQVMRSAGIGARALPQYVAPRVAQTAAGGGGRALVPRVAQNVVGGTRGGLPALRSAQAVGKARTATPLLEGEIIGGVPGMFTGGAQAPISNGLASLLGLAGGTAAASLVPDDDVIFGGDSSVMDGRVPTKPTVKEEFQPLYNDETYGGNEENLYTALVNARGNDTSGKYSGESVVPSQGSNPYSKEGKNNKEFMENVVPNIVRTVRNSRSKKPYTTKEVGNKEFEKVAANEVKQELKSTPFGKGMSHAQRLEYFNDPEAYLNKVDGRVSYD